MIFSRSIVASVGLFVPLSLHAQDKKDAAPRVIAVTSVHLTAGEKTVLRFRGDKLKDATEVRVTPASAAVLKDKKDATVPNGLEAKDVGNTEVAIELTPPADCTKLTVQIVTPGGTTEPREITVLPKNACTAEKEPNNGFREAQRIDLVKPVAGKIDADKDVDVFRIDAHAGKPFSVRVVAADAGSLLDPILSLYDLAGHFLASADDTAGSRDPVLTFTPKKDGPLCLVVTDAQDRGGDWHAYRIEFPQKP